MREPHPEPKELGTRRAWLTALSGALLAAYVAPACATSFDPPSDINTLRVISVDIDKPYSLPGEEITMKMNFVDGLDRENERPIQITWLGGCFDPEGDAYYNCYEPLADILEQIQSGEVPPDGLVAQGVNLDTFKLKIPEDIVTRRPRPPAGPYTGLSIVFFTACAGQVRPIPPEGEGAAGSFPLGCFDEDGNRLGPESFIAGYTQITTFEDERQNPNPTVESLDLAGEPMPEDFAEAPRAEVCDVSDTERARSGCAATDEFAECTTYTLKVKVPKDVADDDPESTGLDGEQLKEVVWVSYFADGGNLDGDSKLVSDASKGYQDGHEVTWVPPTEKGTYRLWAVVRDSRGGSTTIERFVVVE